MRRPDQEPLLFDLPLDRPARDGEAEPVLERRPRAPQDTSALPVSPPPRSPRGAGKGGAARGEAAAPAPRLPLASAAALSTRPAPPAPAAGEASPRPPRNPRQEQAEHPAGIENTASAARGRPAGDAAASPVAGGGAGIGRRLAGGAADLLVHVAVAVLALAGCRAFGVAPAPRDWPAIGVFLLSFSFLYTVVPLAFWGHTLGMTWAGLRAESTDGEPLSFDQTARRWLGALTTLAGLGLPLLLALTGRSLSDRLSDSRTLAIGPA